MDDKELRPLLTRIAEALDRLVPTRSDGDDPDKGDAFVWHAREGQLERIPEVNRVDIGPLQGIDHARDILLRNTRQFANGFPANNALLWGARGTGKSSLVKAVHAAVSHETGGRLALVEIHREDLDSLPLTIARSWYTTGTTCGRWIPPAAVRHAT